MAADNNSFVRQEEGKPSFEDRKKDLVQFSSAKQIKKKEENAFWKWTKDMFFSGRTLKEILKDVAENQIIPQAKDNLRNSLVAIIDLKFYKDHKTTSSSTNPMSNFVTNYVSFSDKQKKALQENKKKEEETIKSGFEYPAFKTQREAEQFIESMHAYVSKYPTMSVLDITWMQGKTIDFNWDKYGWEKEEILAIRRPTHINNPDAPYMIDMPKAHVLT